MSLDPLQIQCPTCNGKGKCTILIREKCPHCQIFNPNNFPNHFPRPNLPCRRCNGCGYIMIPVTYACQKCYGTGTIKI